MGSLILPAAGDVYLDTQAIIYSVEQHSAYGPLLDALWLAARADKISIVSTELTLMESLIGPLKRSNQRLASVYEQLYQSREVHLIPITQPILREGARLRAAIPSLRTPDALHAAAALHHGCAQFITNDLGFRQVPGLPVVILRDLL